ncbi:MAG TPA: hypothetical protein VMW29_03420, partial [Candidatus Bathyarchaeia archaeon]|nr:hypothetical protein [Candidatus Bathyarchaeia archaeon]
VKQKEFYDYQKEKEALLKNEGLTEGEDISSIEAKIGKDVKDSIENKVKADIAEEGGLDEKDIEIPDWLDEAFEEYKAAVKKKEPPKKPVMPIGKKQSSLLPPKEDKFELTPSEPVSKAEEIALRKMKGEIKSVEKSKIRPVIPTGKIKAPTTGKQESIISKPKKDETLDLFDKKPKDVTLESSGLQTIYESIVDLFKEKPKAPIKKSGEASGPIPIKDLNKTDTKKPPLPIKKTQVLKEKPASPFIAKKGPPPWEIPEKTRPENLTDKEILKRRRFKVKAVRDYFGLSDSDLRKISRRDIRLMTNLEFKQYIDGVRKAAEKFDIRRQAMNELKLQIQEKELNVENLRKAMKLPTLKNMTVDDIRKLDEALKPFQKFDEFLSVRKLETVDRTELRGIKTWREARERLSKKLDVPVDELQSIRVSEFDRFRYDTALAEKNPFYRMMVEKTAARMLTSEAEYLNIEKDVFKLAKKIKGTKFLVPQQKNIRKFLEKEPGIELTPEELELAEYMAKHYLNARDYLVQIEAMKMGRENYFTHVRRGILEAVKEDGLVDAIKEQFEAYKLDEQGFNILDKDTGQILAMDKFFKFAMHRTGKLKPTENVVKAFLTYMRTFKKKQALDEIVPLIDIYAHSLTPKGLTKKGLLLHGNLIKFTNEWLNTQKGRHITLVAKQNGKIDAALRAIKMFTSLRDLGINIPVSIATEIGEQITTYQLLGKKEFTLGKIRQNTKKGKAIVEKYRNLVGKNPWSELVEPSKEIGDRLMEGIFVLFKDASTRANKTFLLGSLSKAEFDAGTITPERLSGLRTELGRYRMVNDMRSVIGATPEGKAYTQYRKWALPILRTTIKNLGNIGKKIIGQKPDSAEFKKSVIELYRLLEVTAMVMLTFGMVRDEDDNSFVGKIINKSYREATTLIQALGPTMILAIPRTAKFIEDLGIALTLILKGEEYKSTGGSKGVEKLKNIVTPVAISQFAGENKKSVVPIRQGGKSSQRTGKR